MSPEIWRYVFDSIEDPAFLHDAQFRVMLANRAYCRAAGVTEAQALGKPYWEVFPLGTGPLPGCKDAVSGKGQTSHQAEVNVGAKLFSSQEEVSSGEKLFLSKGYTVRDDQGKQLYSLHLLSDITVQRQAEAALAESQARFRRATETARDAIIILDGEGGAVTAWNPAAEVVFGYDKEEVIGRVLHEIITPPRFRAVATKAMAHFATTGTGAAINQTLELVALHKNGTEFPIELSQSATQLHGKWHATGIARDISERKRAEESLKNLAAKYRTIYESSFDALMLLDEKGFFDCNPATLRIFGCATRNDFINKHPAQLSPPTQPGGEDSMSLSNEHTATAFKNGSNHFEWVHRRLDGTEFPAEVVLTALKLDGKPVLQAALRDISKRKQDELALESANRALRTLSACNEALVRAANESELLDSICRMIVETGGYRMAWVGFPEKDEAKTVRPVARYGYDEGYVAAANISWADSELGRGPAGTAIRTDTVQVEQNLLANPALAPWREAALPRGYHSSIALPLKSAAGTLGVLTLYAAAPDAFNETEVILLQELAGDLAFGIENLRTHAERDRIAHEQLHHAEILRQGLEDSIKAIANTVEMRDPYTAGHQRRVGQLAAAIARELGLPEDTIRGIELAASIHDLGKISIPAEILAKPGKLTDIEFMLLKNHAQAGFDILKDIKFPWPIATIVLQHHERLDGSGYPQGLKGEQILLESRIMAVADVVEAMASHRPYRAALGIDSAMQEIERGRGSVYDAAVVDACLRLFAEQRFTFSS